MNTSLITISDIAIRQDDQGRFCLNDLHEASGKNPSLRPSNWIRTQQSADLISYLRSDMSLSPVMMLKSEHHNNNPLNFEPIIKIQGKGKTQGTYACKELVYVYAMWISPEFHIQVIRAYDALATQQIPYGLKSLPQDLLQISPKELDALVDCRVKKVMEGELQLKADCPMYEAPLSMWQLTNKINKTGRLTYPQYSNIQPDQRPLWKLLKELKRDGHDVDGAMVEYDTLKSMADTTHFKLGMLRDILARFDSYGPEISV